MKIAQRSLLILLLVCCVLGSMFYAYREEKRIFQEQWEVLQVNAFLEKINRDKRCTMEDYRILVEQLHIAGIHDDIYLEIFEKGSYYLLTWKEVQKMLAGMGIDLEPGMLVTVCIEKNTNSYHWKTIYRKIISRKD